ncbi:hypothetical protein AX760_24195 [Pararhizobium antarcticum]|uniref:Uncharacterized protein n=1 Tax=Pararhizobium antarcticum TaxID=1798805 RepID=A0A657LMT8_9HYPH|nr:hypothetical protein [Pararhizobium antarcticum]OJF90653.1 hypothetical protein AX760_24195 [Pararhizobium antarcticum]
MRRADFCRAEQARRRHIAHVPKLSQDGLKAEADVPGNVFEEDPFGTAFPDDAGDLGPEVPGVIDPAALSGRAKGLAGISGEDRVECTAEGPCIEAAQILPDRCWGEISGALGGDEHSSGPVLPFDKGACVIAGFGQHEAQIQASAA